MECSFNGAMIETEDGVSFVVSFFIRILISFPAVGHNVFWTLQMFSFLLEYHHYTVKLLVITFITIPYEVSSFTHDPLPERTKLDLSR